MVCQLTEQFLLHNSAGRDFALRIKLSIKEQPNGFVNEDVGGTGVEGHDRFAALVDHGDIGDAAQI